MNPSTRRHFLATNAMGIGSLALAWLLKQDNLLAAPVQPALEPVTYDLKPKPPHFEPRAKAMISLFMQGGPSQVDLLDPNRQVSPDYVSYTAVTAQGQVLSGLLASETAGGITLRRAEGAQDFVLRSQLEELRATGKSLMPEGMEQNLAPQDVADLLEFLARPDARLFSLGK